MRNNGAKDYLMFRYLDISNIIVAEFRSFGAPLISNSSQGFHG